MPILSLSPSANAANANTNNAQSIPIIVEKPQQPDCIVEDSSNSSGVKGEENLCLSNSSREEEGYDTDMAQSCANFAFVSPGQNNTGHKKRRITSLISRGDDDLVDLSDRRLRSSSLGSLYAGSRFKGLQKCGVSKYNVLVDIQHVDIEKSKICGYLNIEGLTNECPELTTFFEGEIIGPHYSFLTRKWQAEEYIDSAHWGQFPSFEPYAHNFNDDDFTYDPLDNDFIYMRWKEHFLVPDHRVNNIEGASFAGFYYICYQRSTNKIQGFYFYKNNPEWYQQLILEHDGDHSFATFEFR